MLSPYPAPYLSASCKLLGCNDRFKQAQFSPIPLDNKLIIQVSRMIWTSHSAPSSLALRFRSLLRACARDSSVDNGKKLHATVIVTGLVSPHHHFLRNALLHFYAACGYALYARKVFDEIPRSHKDSIDWTTLIGCCARHGMPRAALSFFVDMRREGWEVDEVAMACVFNACARLVDAKFGLQAHAGSVKSGLINSVKLCNAVMDLYVKCGLVSEVRRVFEGMGEHSVVSWTGILEGAVKWEGVESGRAVFDRMPEKNEVAWTIMIVGYVENGFTRDSFSLLKEMIFDCGMGLNYVTLSSILSACSQSGDVALGRWVHTCALKPMGRDMNIMVGTGLVNMYAKCGWIKTALVVFKHMPRRNTVSWNAMLGGLAMHGQGKVLVEMFPRMVKEAKPDAMTFMSLLSACSHTGLVEQGWQYFHSLESVYNIKPEIEHYACMVDLLGRAGLLEAAFAFMKKMPIPPNDVVLGSILGSCRVHSKLQLGEKMMQELVQMDPHNTEYHVLLSNMYALSGKEDKADSLRQVLKSRGIKKMPGVSSIYVAGKLHQFIAGDKTHHQTAEIYTMLDDMIRRLRLAGYVPNTTSQVLSGCSGRDNYREELEEVEQVLFTHSEKLALCFGLISTRSGSPLYIFKNLRICLDCHSAIKIASDIYNREIVVRDRYRFHSFKQGSCSCSDYW